MRLTVWIILFLSVLGPGALLANEPADPTAPRWGFVASRSSGTTQYTLSEEFEHPFHPGTLSDVQSEFEFPLDVVLIGFTAAWDLATRTSRRWGGAVRISTNVTDPSKKATKGSQIENHRVGYRESVAELSMIVSTVDVSFRLTEGERSTLSLLFHYDYQNIRHRLTEFDGWYYDPFWQNGANASGEEPVIEYAIYYASPQIGAAGAFCPNEFSRLALQASVGAVYASCTDNHFLLGRYSQGSGWGLGLNSRASIDLLPGFVKLDWLWAGLTLELFYFHTEGETDRRWYTDTYLPAGTEINNIPHETESFQAHIGVSVGASF